MVTFHFTVETVKQRLNHMIAGTISQQQFFQRTTSTAATTVRSYKHLGHRPRKARFTARNTKDTGLTSCRKVLPTIQSRTMRRLVSGKAPQHAWTSRRLADTPTMEAFPGSKDAPTMVPLNVSQLAQKGLRSHRCPVELW